MASHLDLEEQEQLDALKAFWKRYGSLITWVVILALAAFAGWNFWSRHQSDQGNKAGSMYDQMERAAQAGDVTVATRVFADMKERYPRTAFTQQAGLVAAKLAADKNQLDVAKANLAWVADNAAEGEYRAVARLRLAGLLLDEKKYDDALKQLDGVDAPEFQALAADRRGDALLASGKAEEAKAAYQRAWAGLDARVDYRRLVEAKLNVLGVQPQASAVAGIADAAASGVVSAPTGVASSTASGMTSSASGAESAK